jgi:hypothetical protein
MSIALFDPFSHWGTVKHSKMVRVIQETTFYAESRFRVILLEIIKSDNNRRQWLQILLKRELVSTNQYILCIY